MTNLRLGTFLFAFVAAATIAVAQPKLIVQSEVDWGAVIPTGPTTEQQRVQTRLSLRNTGNATLRVYEIRPSCGCVTTSSHIDSILPDSEASVDITMNLPVANGPLKKTLTIRTNEVNDSIHVVVLKAELVRPIQLSSGFVPFNSSHVGETANGEISITSFALDDVRMTIVPKTDRLTVLSTNPVTLTKGKRETIRFAYKAVSAGSYSVDIELKTTLPGYEAITISGFGVADPILER